MMSSRMIIRFVFLFVLIVSANILHGQVVLDKPVYFIDPVKRSCEMKLSNFSDIELEVELSVRFGYHNYDSLGNMFMEYNDSVMAENHSLAPHIKIFPKKFILGPGSEKNVKCMVNQPRNIPDGAYWTRFTLQSSPVTSSYDTSKTDIPAMMHIITEVNSIFIFPKGDLTLGLDVKGVSVKVDSSELKVFLDYEKTGNIPFWGNLNIEILDEEEEVVETLSVMNVIYKSAIAKYVISTEKLKPGSYTAKIKIDNKRSLNEVPENFILDFDDIEKEYGFVLPN